MWSGAMFLGRCLNIYKHMLKIETLAATTNYCQTSFCWVVSLDSDSLIVTVLYFFPFLRGKGLNISSLVKPPFQVSTFLLIIRSTNIFLDACQVIIIENHTIEAQSYPVTVSRICLYNLHMQSCGPII